MKVHREIFAGAKFRGAGLKKKFFVVLNFAPALRRDHTYRRLISAIVANAQLSVRRYIEIFVVLISAKIAKICNMRKLSGDSLLSVVRTRSCLSFRLYCARIILQAKTGRICT